MLVTETGREVLTAAIPKDGRGGRSGDGRLIRSKPNAAGCRRPAATSWATARAPSSWGPGPGATGGAADGFGGAVCDGTAPLAGPTAARAGGRQRHISGGRLNRAWRGLELGPPGRRSGGRRRLGRGPRCAGRLRAGRGLGTRRALGGRGAVGASRALGPRRVARQHRVRARRRRHRTSIDAPDPVVGAAMGAGSRSGLDGHQRWLVRRRDPARLAVRGNGRSATLDGLRRP